MPRRSLLSQPAVYRICVQGRTDLSCYALFEGMTVGIIEAPDQSVVSELVGLLPDQAALMGVLNVLYNYAIPLISVECISVDPEKI